MQGNVLDGGPGADLPRGLGGSDTAPYGRRTEGVSVSVNGETDDGNAADGPVDARDLVTSDLERIVGGTGDDRLLGDDRANTLTAASGRTS